MLLVKLGGSVLTDKKRLRTPRRSTIARLAREVAQAQDDLLLVHGAGSFGHILARRHRLHEGLRSERQRAVAAEVQRDVKALDGLVVDALLDAGLSPVSLAPSALLSLDDGRVASFDASPFREFASLGMTPVTFGDVVRDQQRGVAICSGDVLMLELAKAFRPSRALFVADVDGLYAADPKRSKSSKILESLRSGDIERIRFDRTRSADVTGGMEGKVRRMVETASYVEECIILNGNVKNRVRDAVRGRPVVGTRVTGGI